MIPPQLFLLLLLAVTAGAYLICSAACSRCHGSLRKLAACKKMHYIKQDLFGLGPRIESHWPIPDCSEWQVLDVIYGSAGTDHRYVFSVEFTLGPLDQYRRELRVATFSEPSDQPHAESPKVTLADRSGSVVEQYERLIGPG